MALERGGYLRWAQRSRCAVAFVDPALLAFLLLFSLVISFGRACAVCPSVVRIVVSGGCYTNIAGRKPISVKHVVVVTLGYDGVHSLALGIGLGRRRGGGSNAVEGRGDGAERKGGLNAMAWFDANDENLTI